MTPVLCHMLLRTRRTPAVIPVVIAFATLASAQAPPHPDAYRGPKGVDASDLNRQVDPCTDFYEFANGAWRAANPIPASKSRWLPRIAAPT